MCVCVRARACVYHMEMYRASKLMGIVTSVHGIVIRGNYGNGYLCHGASPLFLAQEKEVGLLSGYTSANSFSH